MAEVLAIGASVIAIVQITDRIVGLCKFYIKTVNDAPSDLRLILLETSALKTIFENLSFLTACDSGVSHMVSGLASVDGPIEGCLRSVTQLEKLFPLNWIQDTGQSRSKKRKVKATLAALAWPLKEGKARKLLDEISRYKTTVTLALTTESSQDIKEIKAKTAEIHGLLTESQRQEVYRWLQHTDPSSLHFRAQKDYEPGTGNWILRTPEWSSWLSAKKRCLWIHGIPGAGKTVLVSHLIQHIKEHCSSSRTKKCACVYYYCYFGRNQNETAPFLRWLVNQLCRQADSTPRYVYRLYKECGEPDFEELLVALGEALEEFDCIYLAIDALDESIPRNDLLQVLRALATDPNFQKVQLLASSREYIDIEKVMGEFSVSVSMANPCVEEDIRLHVRSSLESNCKFKRSPQELLDEVEDTLSKGAQGMFRWAVCQIDVLQRLKCERRIVEKALKNLPNTLDATYDVILLAMPQDELVVVNHILQWISYHNELYNGQGIPCEVLIQAVGKSTAELAVDGLERFYDNDTLRELCGCLIKIMPEEQVNSYIGLRHTTLTASFAHYTVREYLDSSRSKNSMLSLAVHQDELRQKFLGVILSEAQHLESNKLWKLKNASIDPSDALDAVNRNLSVYSVVSAFLSLCEWPTEISQHEMLCPMAIELLNPSKCHFETLECTASVIEASLELFSEEGLYVGSQLWQIHWHPETSNMVAVHLLHLLLLAEDVSKCLLFAEKFLQARDTRDFLQARLRLERPMWGVTSEECTESYLLDGSIIEVYAQLGTTHTRTLKLLLDYGTGLFDCSKILLLHIGNHEHDPEHGCQGDCLIRRLLDLGADPNSSGSRITPLQIAVISGDLDGVSTLLDAGADPNDTGSSEGTVWEDGTLMSRFNLLDGASALYICKNFEDFLEESHARLWKERKIDTIEATLLRHGAKEILRA